MEAGMEADTQVAGHTRGQVWVRVELLWAARWREGSRGEPQGMWQGRVRCACCTLVFTASYLLREGHLQDVGGTPAWGRFEEWSNEGGRSMACQNKADLRARADSSPLCACGSSHFIGVALSSESTAPRSVCDMCVAQ